VAIFPNNALLQRGISGQNRLNGIRKLQKALKIGVFCGLRLRFYG
jgi:hypothetical protein